MYIAWPTDEENRTTATPIRRAVVGAIEMSNEMKADAARKGLTPGELRRQVRNANRKCMRQHVIQDNFGTAIVSVQR